ncbi:hypothetical protein FGIG_03614 [Fasciola gigantica]|uniref:Uncharacterized protein n=1 Tax=Fasciola gigantica TaxID=46835 RepID=A0A504YC90_FASGI|nr:hypothetical protein FGIG_03614 [Fasciola gigantica]
MYLPPPLLHLIGGRHNLPRVLVCRQDKTLIDIWGEQCAHSGVFENIPAAPTPQMLWLVMIRRKVKKSLQKRSNRPVPTHFPDRAFQPVKITRSSD